MPGIFEKLSSKFPLWRDEVNSLIKSSADKVVSEVTVSQLYGGMRGVRSLVCDTSRVPQETGLIIRGKLLKDVIDRTPEEIFYLLLTGEFPSSDELKEFSSDLKRRKNIPSYVWDVLKAMPKDSHPMTMLDTAILVLQKESVFAKHYDEGMKKEDYWKYTLEDAMNLVAKVPGIAAGIYRMHFDKGEIIPNTPDMDITGDYVHMLGLENNKEEFYELMRIYLVAHSDHEGGNVSAFAAQVVNSALSDLYYSLSAGLNGLAGPLHGLANQEALKWILELMERYNGAPSHDQLKDLVWEQLNSGKVIPGYGHAVLRVTDPRFEAFLNFGKKHCSDDPVFQTVARLYDVVPVELKKIEKIKNPWPNVDASSGSLLYHYGLKEFSYYTVIFAVSRTIGICSQAVINRGMLNPIVRPKSITTDWVKEHVNS